MASAIAGPVLRSESASKMLDSVASAATAIRLVRVPSCGSSTKPASTEPRIAPSTFSE